MPEDNIIPPTMAPPKAHFLPTDCKFDRKNPNSRKTWNGFKRHFETYIDHCKSGYDGTTWTEAISKRMLFLSLGEHEQIMAGDIFSETNINSTDPENTYGTLKKMLTQCSILPCL